MQAKGGDYFKMLGPGNAFPVINAAETRGLDKLAYLAVREASVELWDQKADGEVLKKVEIRQAQQWTQKCFFKIWQLKKVQRLGASLGGK